MAAFPTVVLLATDGSADAELAGRAAADLARRAGAELHVAHAWHVPALMLARAGLAVPTDLDEATAAQARTVLQAEGARLAAAGAEVTQRHLVEGAPAVAVLRVAGEVGADLIVLGSRGLGGVRRLVLGSVSEEVVHHSHVPVLILRGTAWPPERIVIADDGSPEAEAAADRAVAIASLLGCAVTIIEVIPHFRDADIAVPGMSVETALVSVHNALESRAERLGPALGAAPEIAVVVDEPAVGILDAAEEEGRPALIAVGTRGAGTMARMRFGSVSTKVLRAAQVPVLVTPPV